MSSTNPTGGRVIQAAEQDGPLRNRRETGQRDLVAFPEETDRDRDGALAEVREPRRKLGLREPQSLTQDKTRESDTLGLASGEGEAGNDAADAIEPTLDRVDRRPL